MSYIKDYYQESCGKAAAPLKEKELARIQVTLSLIPENIDSILDIGCGDGRITNLLASKYRVVGTDFVFAPLKNISPAKSCMNINALAFKPSCFDLVLLTEVLEHLPAEIFRNALEEIQRVSKKYILITVPYRENLKSGFVKCNKCGLISHVWHHVRSFKNKPSLTRFFPDYLPVKYVFFVGKRNYHNNTLLFIKQHLGNRWHRTEETTICPQCGNGEFINNKRNLVSLLCSATEKILASLVPRVNKRYAGVLYIPKKQ